MTPENLIDCAKLYDYYTNGFSEDSDSFNHHAHIHLPEIKPPQSSASTTGASHLFSAPSLMDLLNDDNILPSEIDTRRLEEEWFNKEDPYDLAESDRADASKGIDINIVRCNTRWNVADYIKLDSPALAALIKHLAGENDVMIVGGVHSASSEFMGPIGSPGDWDIEDYC